MLPRQPLRFLLADDPGAGKTIMAGLYIKELIIRGDLERCIIIAPGSLTRQWQDELRDKFDLRFDILTKADLDNIDTINVFDDKPLLIARVDQLARRLDDLEPVLERCDWDLAIVDEAHRMSAHFYSDEIKQTLRYRLGVAVGAQARHFLLMTATPHNGKEEDFQLFLALLDSDRFAGRFRDGVHAAKPSDLMRRMVKEKLVRFDGTPLFPERRSYSVEYELSPDELTLYDEVTSYVREQMNAADRLRQEGQGRRGNTVGFALTIMQRRLASSPEAIYQSLSRRRKKLELRVIEERQAARNAALGITTQQERLSALLEVDDATIAQDQTTDELLDGIDVDAYDDLDEDERDEFDTEVVDAATAAATVEELEKEIETLKLLESLAFNLRESGVDKKWTELSNMLSDSPEMFGPDGERRKLIIFTEHRDTLNYLVDRLRTFLGEEAVVWISGGTSRDERRVIQQQFTQDKETLVLVATDAAGEGINLQRAHLMVNYDLPWNPNRIEQRFGRVHRIGQQEVCHMWNIIAAQTREAQVYLRLLDKIERMKQAFDGQVYDVLGQAISGQELKALLLQAIRYGDDPEVRDRINQVIENDVEQRVTKAIDEPVLAANTIGYASLERIRELMEEAALRRMQPHYVQSFFEEALRQFGGQLQEQEPSRYELDPVPAALVQRDRRIGTGTPLPKRFERLTFEKDLVQVTGAPIAELVAPGHPLLNALIDLVLETHRQQFTQGVVFVNDNDFSTTPKALVMLEHEVADNRPTSTAQHTVVSSRFEFIELPKDGEPVTATHAPYLDYRPAAEEELAHLEQALNDGWLASNLEERGLEHAAEVAVPDHLAQVRIHTETRVDATEKAVYERLQKEISFWDNRVLDHETKAAAGKNLAANIAQAKNRAEELAMRLKSRREVLAQERAIKALSPKVVAGALVIPAGMLPSSETTIDLAARKEVETRAVQAVLRTEEQHGWDAIDMNDVRRNNPGYDVKATRRETGSPITENRYIEVKGRISGSTTVTVSRNEILTSLNDPQNWLLALVEVEPGGGEEVRYVKAPFQGSDSNFLFGVTSVSYDWAPLWERGTPTHD